MLLARVSSPLRFNAELKRDLEAEWLYYLTTVQPAFDALINDIPVLARANAQKRIQDAEPKQRQLATHLSEKEAMRLSIFESYAKGNLTQPEFRQMMDMIAADISGIEAAQRAFVAEAEAVLQLTADTNRTDIPVEALLASAHLTEKLTVQNALFPEGISYRKNIGFSAPPDNEVAAIAFRTLISLAAEPDWEEIKSGRPLLPILNRIAQLRTCRRDA